MFIISKWEECELNLKLLSMTDFYVDLNITNVLDLDHMI